MRTKQGITPAQLRRLQVEFKRLLSNGQVQGPRGEQFAGDERECRLAWARAWLGIGRLKTFLDLTLLEACFLIDIAAEKPTALDKKLTELWPLCGVVSPAAWLAECQADESRKKLFWELQGRALHELNRFQKIKLVNLLDARFRVARAA